MFFEHRTNSYLCDEGGEVFFCRNFPPSKRIVIALSWFVFYECVCVCGHLDSININNFEYAFHNTNNMNVSLRFFLSSRSPTVMKVSSQQCIGSGPLQ